jgi:hypothetical protein
MSMAAPQFVRLSPELHRAHEHRVVAMPLDEVGAAHERAVLRGAAIVMPEIEEDEVDCEKGGPVKTPSFFSDVTISDAVCT